MMYRKNIATGCGMWALWDFETYKAIDDYDKWEPLFCEDEDIQKQVETSNFVPVYIHSDGVCSFEVKIDGSLSEREQKYVCVSSEKYLLHSNGKVFLSGIDDIGGSVSESGAIALPLEAGYYAVTVHLLSWNEEPGAYLEDGSVSPDSLPDFVVIIESGAAPDGEYRKTIETFDEPQ